MNSKTNKKVLEKMYENNPLVQLLEKEEDLKKILDIFPTRREVFFTDHGYLIKDYMKIFIVVTDEYIITVDNRTGDAWTEDYNDILSACTYLDEILGYGPNELSSDSNKFIEFMGNGCAVVIWLFIILLIISIILNIFN